MRIVGLDATRYKGFSPWHYGINEGPIVAMIENYQSGRVWRLTRGCPAIVAGLRAAGFTGGWLANEDGRAGIPRIEPEEARVGDGPR